ncbi:MAG: caspase family protein [Bacteroidales bacterium]|nr:caspase family protein [Bacteroidales bacterium]MBN2763169.1 caspase family protein [Bacteroidales bacterium]
MKKLVVLALICCSLMPCRIHSQTAHPVIPPQQKRLALVIGNGNYLTGILSNPENDARAMNNVLQNVGFEVMAYENLNQSQLKRAIDDFGMKLKNYQVGLFYYAGHGIQCNGHNYLVPVDAQITFERQIEYDCVPADRVLAIMQESGAEVNIMVLDACRNNPFERSWTRSASGTGLAFMNAPKGTLIAYATSPGSIASDGSGENGLYTAAILEHIETPDITILQMFQQIRNTVAGKSNNQQIPWESTSLTGDFFFSHSSYRFDQRPVVGEIKEVVSFGNIMLTTEISGELYLDSLKITDVSSHTIIPIDRVTIGSHKLSIKGRDNWTEDITINRGQTTRIYAKISPPPQAVPKVEKPKEVLQVQNTNEFIDDRDGKKYKWIRIGKQIWMAENLAYLPKVNPPTTGSLASPCYYVYGYSGNDVEKAKATGNYITYGVLYNWPAALNGSSPSDSKPSRVQGICPNGWHLPSVAEWFELIVSLNNVDIGDKIKESGNEHWKNSNANVKNSTGFTALPAGRRHPEGYFHYLGNHCYFWTSSKAPHKDAWFFRLTYNSSVLYRGNETREIGFCIRCIKD